MTSEEEACLFKKRCYTILLVSRPLNKTPRGMHMFTSCCDAKPYLPNADF